MGGACYPEVHPDSANKQDDIANLKKKVEAGCEYLTTQMFLITIFSLISCIVSEKQGLLCR